MVDIQNYPIDSYDYKADTLTIASGIAIIHNHKICVVREDDESLFSFPGGTMKDYESPQATAIREVQEELSLDIEIAGDPFIYKIRDTDEKKGSIEFIVLFHFYAGRIQGNLKLGSDAREIKWKGIEDSFADCFPNVKPAFEYFYNKYEKINNK